MHSPNVPKKPVGQDWPRIDIKHAIERAGWTLSALSKHHGYHRNAVSSAIQHPWPRVEKLIAAAIGVTPQQIWPSRYDASGRPNRPMGRRPKPPAQPEGSAHP